MNLTGDPFIPVVFRTGKTKEVGLIEFYKHSPDILDLVATPPQRIALMRLFICISQRALDGPLDEADWARAKDRMIPESVSYLEKWKDRFELYGDHPFLQVRTLTSKNMANLDKLDFSLAAGNNATLFDRDALSQNRKHSAGWSALNLVTYQCFSPGGTIGEAFWGKTKTKETSEHAPCVESSCLHTIVIGPEMLTTIYMNMITRDEVEALPGSGWGKPSWEVSLNEKDDELFKPLLTSYLGRLMPLSRAVLLTPSSTEFILANGLTYPKLPDYREISGTVIMKGKGKKEKEGYVSIDLEKHPWRELGSLISMNGKGKRSGALPLKHFRSLSHATDESIDIWTGGLAADKGKIKDVAEWRLAVPVNMLEDRLIEKYQEGISLAMRGEGSISIATKAYSVEFKTDNIFLSKAKKYFWSILDTQYPVLLEASKDPNADLSEVWYPVVRKAMEKAYHLACPKDSSRQMQAYIKGLNLLRLKKK